MHRAQCELSAPVVTELDLILLLLPSVAELVLLPAGLGRAHGACVVQALMGVMTAGFNTESCFCSVWPSKVQKLKLSDTRFHQIEKLVSSSANWSLPGKAWLRALFKSGHCSLFCRALRLQRLKHSTRAKYENKLHRGGLNFYFLSKYWRRNVYIVTEAAVMSPLALHFPGVKCWFEREHKWMFTIGREFHFLQYK